MKKIVASLAALALLAPAAPALAQRNDGDLSASITTFQTVVRDYPGTPEAREAISVARSVYDEANRIDDYLEWIPTRGAAALLIDADGAEHTTTNWSDYA